MPHSYQNDPLFIPYNHMLNLVPNRKQFLNKGPRCMNPGVMRRNQPTLPSQNFGMNIGNLHPTARVDIAQPNPPRPTEPNMMQRAPQRAPMVEPRKENGSRVWKCNEKICC